MDRQAKRGADYAGAARQKSYQLAPRATIFRRDAGDVTDLGSLKRLMRSNSFSSDPVSHFASDLPAPSLYGADLERDHGLSMLRMCRHLLQKCTSLDLYNCAALQLVL